MRMFIFFVISSLDFIIKLCIPRTEFESKEKNKNGIYRVSLNKAAFTRCRHILKTTKNVTVAKFELAFTRCRNNLKTVGNLPVKGSLQDFDAN